MKRAKGQGENSASEHTSPHGQQEDDSDDGNVEATEVQDGDSDPGQRREIRSKYRELICAVRENREDLLSLQNNHLTEILEKANTLFRDVQQTREAVLDSQLLVVTTDLGKEKASQMLSEGSSFDHLVFADHLLSFMGLNRLEDGEEEQQNGGAVGGFLPADAWHRVAQWSASCFRTAPTFHYMMGSFHTEPPPPKQRVERQRKAPAKEVQGIIPTQLKKMEESHHEATEKEVERILGYLRGYHNDDPSSPISYYEFVIDPESFSRTVENIFHTSFLIRDGLAQMYLDDDKLPCIAPSEQVEGVTADPLSRQQCIVSISYKDWKKLVEVFEIKNAMIHPPNIESE